MTHNAPSTEQVLDEHSDTWRSNGLADLDYELLDTAAIGPHATKYRVDVKLNGHWTDTVQEPPQTQERAPRGGQRPHDHPREGKRSKLQ
jgi:hypothetical protein